MSESNAPRQIGNYDLIEPVGAGSIGTIVDRISPRHAARLLKNPGPQAAPGPVLAEPRHDERFEARVVDIAVYAEAPHLAERASGSSARMR